MEWFNIYGFIFKIAIMIPNIIFAIKNGTQIENKYKNRLVESIEQIGRFGCICFMIFNIPMTCFEWWADNVFTLYLIVDALLIVLYIIIWIFCWHKNNIFKALSLSIIPSILFLFSGVFCG